MYLPVVNAMGWIKVGRGELTQTGKGIKLVLDNGDRFYLICEQVDKLLDGKIESCVVSMNGGE